MDKKAQNEVDAKSKCACEDCDCDDVKCTCDGEGCDCGKECKCDEDCKHEKHDTATDSNADIKAELEQEKGNRMQLLADFVNYRKRAEKEREEMHISANKVLLHQIIEIVDDFTRAITLESDKVPVENDFYQGVSLIQKKLSDLLSMYDLQEIVTNPGDEYSHVTMEAVTTAPVQDPKQANKVQHVVGKGYLNKSTGQVFRPVRVVIGKK